MYKITVAIRKLDWLFCLDLNSDVFMDLQICGSLLTLFYGIIFLNIYRINVKYIWFVYFPVPFVAPFLTHASSMGPHTIKVQWTVSKMFTLPEIISFLIVIHIFKCQNMVVCVICEAAKVLWYHCCYYCFKYYYYY